MARPLRLEFADALYHVTSRGNDKQHIFLDDLDRRMFLTFLGQAVERFGWILTAWVLMSNHYHLIVQTPELTLSKGMHWLNTTYVTWFNRRHDRSGHLLEGRFKSPLIEKETHLRRALRYVVLNPVRAKMVASPELYQWSSYRATAGLELAEPWLATDALLSLFDPDPDAARRNYQDFVLANVDGSDRLWDELINGMYLGSVPWAKGMRTIVESKLRSSDHPKKQRSVGRPELHEIVSAVATIAGHTETGLRATRGGPIRRLIAWLGWHEGLVTLSKIAATLRLRSEGHVSGMIHRCEMEFGSDEILAGQLKLATAALRG